MWNGLLHGVPLPFAHCAAVYTAAASATLNVPRTSLPPPPPAAMNMLALLQIGPSLERALGSLQFLATMVLLLVLGDAAYVGIAYLWALAPLHSLPAFLDFMRQCAVGFSGILFGLVRGGRWWLGSSVRYSAGGKRGQRGARLLWRFSRGLWCNGASFGSASVVCSRPLLAPPPHTTPPMQVLIDNHASGGERRSIFGFFSVPARLYPWVLLVVWQLLVPQASFLGHLTGLLVRFCAGRARWEEEEECWRGRAEWQAGSNSASCRAAGIRRLMHAV